jgi:hypothetical protein
LVREVVESTFSVNGKSSAEGDVVLLHGVARASQQLAGQYSDAVPDLPRRVLLHPCYSVTMSLEPRLATQVRSQWPATRAP